MGLGVEVLAQPELHHPDAVLKGLRHPQLSLESQKPWNTIPAAQLCADALPALQINSLKFKAAVGMDIHSWGAADVSQINHPRCEQNFHLAFLHILFSCVSLKLKSLFNCNILALESFFFSRYSLIACNPFIPLHFPATPPLPHLSRCAQPITVTPGALSPPASHRAGQTQLYRDNWEVF